MVAPGRTGSSTAGRLPASCGTDPVSPGEGASSDGDATGYGRPWLGASPVRGGSRRSAGPPDDYSASQKERAVAFLELGGGEGRAGRRPAPTQWPAWRRARRICRAWPRHRRGSNLRAATSTELPAIWVPLGVSASVPPERHRGSPGRSPACALRTWSWAGRPDVGVSTKRRLGVRPRAATPRGDRPAVPASFRRAGADSLHDELDGPAPGLLVADVLGDELLQLARHQPADRDVPRSAARLACRIVSSSSCTVRLGVEPPSNSSSLQYLACSTVQHVWRGAQTRGRTGWWTQVVGGGGGGGRAW